MARGMSGAKLLIENGFIKSKYEGLYTKDQRSQKFKIVDPEKFSMNESHAEEEIAEDVNYTHNKKLQATGYPKPHNRYRIIYESFNLSMEETYYWFLTHLRQDWGYEHADKIVDIFSAAENSAFFGQSAQRLSIQEDRASNFLRVIGQMVKELFQIIRELRVIDERLEPYKAWVQKGSDGTTKHSKSADVTLKGVFADFAENKGGQMQPGSLYHLAQTVGYSALPDLFFNTHIYDKDKVDTVIDKMDSFNPNVRQVLRRKLYQYLVWKEKTENELTHRRTFLIRYLRQHWATIKMYMNWTKPYLRHIKRLQMNEQQLDSPDLISAFETSMTEIEVLFHKPWAGANACVLMTFQFTTRPIMQYRQDAAMGPVHVGRVNATMRAYGWSDEDIANYKKLKEDEDKELLRLVDDSVAAAMDELGDDLEKYINMEGEDVFDETISERYGQKPKENSKVNIRTGAQGTGLEPITSLFFGFKDMFFSFIPSPSKKSKPKGKKVSSSAKKEAAKKAEFFMWQSYKNYKKSHGLLSW